MCFGYRILCLAHNVHTTFTLNPVFLVHWNEIAAKPTTWTIICSRPSRSQNLCELLNAKLILFALLVFKCMKHSMYVEQFFSIWFMTGTDHFCFKQKVCVSQCYVLIRKWSSIWKVTAPSHRCRAVDSHSLMSFAFNNRCEVRESECTISEPSTTNVCMRRMCVCVLRLLLTLLFYFFQTLDKKRYLTNHIGFVLRLRWVNPLHELLQ